MFWRQLLLFCAGLDLLGGLLVVAVVEAARGAGLLQQSPWLAVLLLGYLVLGWLLGSYTVLRWPWLQLRLVVLRLLLTALATLLLMILVDWLFNLPVQFPLTHRSTLLLVLTGMTAWALVVRLVLRRLVRRRPEERWRLVADAPEAQRIQREWQRTPYMKDLRRVDPDALPAVGGLVLSPSLQLAPEQERRLESLAAEGVPITGVIELAETQLERLPPALLPPNWLRLEELPWTNSFSAQRQLKRFADLLLSALLLLLSLPLLLLAALLIWLEDRGPVFYVQQRSGLHGTPFALLKLRTMTCADPDAPPSWTQPRDCRITRVGWWLRRLRLDELPQLLNVLSGQMSLIGPRPERPELEQELEQRIPHYRKRHWMRPGLSGWAQVCAPYAASVEEAELKLSYDLYYLRRWGTGLDLLILAKTIKTVLKARGR